MVYKWASLSALQCLMAVILVGLSFISYRGIADNHATHNSKSDTLAGGAFLDMLGLVSFVQFSSFFSDRVYWLGLVLLAIPLQAGWKLYSTMKSAIPGQSTGATTSPSENEQSSEKADEKRQKRAERSRRKW